MKQPARRRRRQPPTPTQAVNRFYTAVWFVFLVFFCGVGYFAHLWITFITGAVLGVAGLAWTARTSRKDRKDRNRK